MNAAGWVMMIIAVGGMTFFFIWCIHRVLTTPGSTEHLHSQRDRTPDENGEPSSDDE